VLERGAQAAAARVRVAVTYETEGKPARELWSKVLSGDEDGP